ncbi:MAG: 1-acyl-sn-glycerol-3-phosphate acyltransferase [Microscillaceae bacterium]|nr:1-acyl-sn-glycerol-3-phosphate acyltransferase [Microscillaceae bacterium]
MWIRLSHFFRRLYTLWAGLMFSFLMLLLLPFFHFFADRPGGHPYAAALNRAWARGFFWLAFLPYRIEWRFKPRPGALYIYCANHTSWLDIVAMGLVVKGDHVFVGKESLAKIPLFGPMFAKLHILVNRESRTSSFRALVQSMQAIDQNQSVVIFPEGGIRTPNPPRLAEFKDGPFRIAIEKQVPILPVVMLHNWYILPNDGLFLARWRPGKAIVLPPITTEGLALPDLESLKAQTLQVMDAELEKYYPKPQIV